MRGREAKASQLLGSALEFGARYRQGAGVLMDPQSSKQIAERPRWSTVNLRPRQWKPCIAAVLRYGLISADMR